MALAVAGAGASGAASSQKSVLYDAGGNAIPATATSFDCVRAKAAVEQMICHDSALAVDDGILAETYQFLIRRSAPSARARIRREQSIWLARRNACTSPQCVADTYDKRTEALWAAVDKRERFLRRGLAKVGDCETTRIDTIEGRLDGQPPDGTTVLYEDGVHQVSYDHERAAWHSRVGDRARVCLIAIPEDCPAGDDRGRIYATTNLRTGGKWQMPDAEHMCGGA